MQCHVKFDRKKSKSHIAIVRVRIDITEISIDVTSTEGSC
jgi:hypothetical protein